MFISYVKLVNFIGILIGQHCETFEIEMDNKYPITLIAGINGAAKSVLLSALSSPFAYDGGIDNRSTVNIIRTGYLGEKILHYVDGNDKYIVHHYYKPNQNDSHSVKSYIAKNGVELNPNGNVSSFEQIIQSIFGITPKDLLLSRLGTNTTSFSSMGSMERKKYLSRIIGDIDSYMALFREIQSDIRVNRELINKFTVEMAKLKVNDIDMLVDDRDHWKKKSDKLLMSIGKMQSELDVLNADAGEDTTELMVERVSLLEKVSFAESMDADLKRISVDGMRKKRSELEEKKNRVTARINSIRANMDSNSRGIEFANMDLQKLEIDDTLSDKMDSLQSELDELGKLYQKFHPAMSSGEFSKYYQRVGVVRTLMTVVVRSDQEIINTVLDLYQKEISLDEWVDKSMSSVVDLDTKQTMHQHMQKLIQNGYSLPECTDANCVYRKLGVMISETDQKSTMTLDFIRSVQDTYKSYVGMLMEARQLLSPPKQLSAILSDRNLNELLSRGEVFSLDLFDQYQRTLLGYESYQQKLQQMSMYKEQESSKKRLVILRGEAMKRIQEFEECNKQLELKIVAAKQELREVSSDLEKLDIQIGKKLEYENVKSLLPSYQKRIKEITERLNHLDSIRPKMQELRQKISESQSELKDLQSRVEEADTTISLYKKYQSDIVSYGKLIAEQQKILRNVTPKDKGIPLLYMRRFFDKIRLKCNELLDITYDGSLKIGEFDPSSPVFDIPYIKNGIMVRDVKLSSQGERPLIDIALEFAMSSMLANHRYNILCCDELDSTLDYKKKQKYPEMLNLHINSMGIEQCFVISHSEVFNSIPTNVIPMNPDDEMDGVNVYKIIRS